MIHRVDSAPAPLSEQVSVAKSWDQESTPVPISAASNALEPIASMPEPTSDCVMIPKSVIRASAPAP